MRLTDASGRSLSADGAVVRVDTVNRELTVRFADGLRAIDVPPGCPITLRGERVRLRLLQPQDLVRVTYTDHPGTRVATAVEVRSGRPAPETLSRLDGGHALPTSPAEHHPRPVRGGCPTGQ